jgi:hypothetical protein
MIPFGTTKQKKLNRRRTSMTNHLYINKKVWNTFSAAEMAQYQTDVFKHFKAKGFPFFPTSAEWRDKEMVKLMRYDYTKCILEDVKEIKQTMHGLSLCWSYHPHHYEVQCNSMQTVSDAFNHDDTLKKVIAKRIKMGDNMSDNGLRKMLKIFTGVQCVSNFRPTAAAAIYTKFTPKNGSVYDMSCGYGGRMMGAHIAGMKYYGVEPCAATFQGLNKMQTDFNIDANIRQEGSEIGGWLPDNSVDMCFTSPPYFDCEKYSKEETQSYIKYPTKELWLKGFMRDTLNDCYRVTKPGGVIALNIQNVKTYKNLVADVIEMCGRAGIDYVMTWGLQLSRLGKGGIKLEPILIFVKRGGEK